jgi:hypothetical protein
MDSCTDCEDCKRIAGGFANGMRCDKHGVGMIHNCIPAVMRYKSSIEIIIDRLESIEFRLGKLEINGGEK